MSKKNKKGDTREVKQIYLSEDGESETSVTTAVLERPDTDKESDEKGKKDHSVPIYGHGADHSEKDDMPSHRKSRAIRIAAVVFAMIFSLLLSMSVGAGLALWDSNRTVADLATVLKTKEVSAITAAKTPVSAKNTEEKKASSDKEKKEEKKEEKKTVKEEKADYGSTLSADKPGVNAVSKAGTKDEIVSPEDEEEPALIDPMADYPLEFSTVDESYFTDALFIGDSRLQGFGFWSGLPATYYCATGFQLYKYDTANVVQTENGKVPIFDAMPYDAFTKIYIKVGLNELGFGTEENFESKYAELIAKLREYEPRAVIYVHAILPVTAAKSSKDKAHNNPNITERNASLKKFAESQKAYFIEASPDLSLEDGSLKPEMTSDGIHLRPEDMKVWREYLCEHAIVIQQQ
ncbi:MAG: hypothetical protein K6F73_01990 [Lachnospiraceae bacterium]|nr:hypothetical protein [Lachnospiraceae bacterium]